MIIEGTIKEIGDFLRKLKSTFAFLLFEPQKLLLSDQQKRSLKVLRASVFFLIAYFGFLCISFSNRRAKGIGQRLTFDQLVGNLKQITENLTEVERFLYLAALLLVIYYSNILVSYILRVPKAEKKNFQQNVLYYISLSVIVFILMELLQLFLGEKLNAFLLNNHVICYKGASIINWIAYKVYLSGKYVITPLIYLYAITKTFYAKTDLYIRYLIATICIIFVVNYVIFINEAVSLLIDPKESNIQLKGSMLGPTGAAVSYGRIQPILKLDSSNKVMILSIDLYVCNNTDSAIVIPQNDTLFLRAETADDLQKYNSQLDFEPGSWDPFYNQFILQASLFDEKSEKYGLIKPAEIKLVSFTRTFQQKETPAAYQRLFADNLALTARLNVYETSVSTLASKQAWIILPLTQRLFLAGKTK